MISADSEKAWEAAERSNAAPFLQDKDARGVYYRGLEVMLAFRAYSDAELLAATDGYEYTDGITKLIGAMNAHFIKNFQHNLIGTDKEKVVRMLLGAIVEATTHCMTNKEFHIIKTQARGSNDAPHS
jgi:hypothetical protein